MTTATQPHTVLRKGIDHVGLCIVYFCHDGQGNFIMAKRNANTRDEHGRWDIGGGGIELHSTVEQTIKDELFEEYCTTVLSHEFLGYRDVHREHQGQRTHWVSLDFKILVDRKAVRNGEPHKFDDVRWFTKDTLPPKEEVHSQLPHFLDKYHSRLFAVDPSN